MVSEKQVGLVGFRTLRGREVGRCCFRIRCGKIVVEVVVVLVAEFHGAAAHLSGGVLGASLKNGCVSARVRGGAKRSRHCGH